MPWWRWCSFGDRIVEQCLGWLHTHDAGAAAGQQPAQVALAAASVHDTGAADVAEQAEGRGVEHGATPKITFGVRGAKGLLRHRAPRGDRRRVGLLGHGPRVSLEAHQLRAAWADVDQEQDQGGVAAVLEAFAGAGRQETAQAVLGHHGDWLLGHDGPLHLCRRVAVDLVLFVQPSVEDAQHLVVGGGGARGPVGEQVAEERLQVGPAGVDQADAPRGQERFGLAERHQVAGDSALRAVLGAQVPLEGAEQRAQGGAVHAPKISQ
jgi:hypothetical protein